MKALTDLLDPLAAPFGRMKERDVLWLIVILALLLRLTRAILTPVVNSDAAFYLYQAKAIYYGLWSQVSACMYPHVTLHPLLSAFFYGFTHNWIVSMRAVSLLLGTLTLFPLYALARLFFDFHVSAVITLLYAVMSVFSQASVDIGREPAYAFFVAGGLYFVAAALKRGKLWFMTAGSVAFALAFWNRMDAAIYPIMTCLFLLLGKVEERGKVLLSFLAPYMIILPLMFALSPAGLSTVESLTKTTSFTESYQALRADLHGLMEHPPSGWKFPSFFGHSASLLWFLGLGVVLHQMAVAMTYPFFLVFLLGLISRWNALRHDRLVGYLSLLCLGSFVMLYCYVFHTWHMEERWTMSIIIPGSIFLGYGTAKIIGWFQRAGKLSDHLAVTLFVILVLVISLPKEIRLHDGDKRIFKEIGEVIARREHGSLRPIAILALGDTGRIISLYGNLHVPTAACPDPDRTVGISAADIARGRLDSLFKAIKERRLRYLVWEEKHWPPTSDHLLLTYLPRKVKIIGKWSHKDTGRIVLFACR